ncbi:asparaginase [Comamonas kerstersii]|uniref:asparaginase n=1 Tax=Comamonas kerstersii TaxID=225992 RepID=UPI000E9EE486|nr:asparaginase [Comamonas kerstersii]
MQVLATRKIVVLGTGGTIAGQGAAMGGSVGYKAGQIGVAELLQPIAQLALQEHFALEVEQVAQLDSKDMDVQTWQQLAQACQKWLAQEDVAGIVITHGTDTLEETAWFLQLALQPAKPVVLTCAMRPATALSADGPANLRDALICASSSVAGVWMTAVGEIYSAQWVRKVHPYRVNAFASGAQGPAGWVEEGRVRWASELQPQARTVKQALPAAVWDRPAAQWPWVEIVTSTALARPEAVDALVAAGVQGLVVAGTGNGSIHQRLLEALQRAVAQGVPVWRCTRCEQGVIVLADGERDANVVALSPVKARISLMLALLQQAPHSL